MQTPPSNGKYRTTQATINTHSADQWSEDLMLDCRFFDISTVGEILAIRTVKKEEDSEENEGGDVEIDLSEDEEYFRKVSRSKQQLDEDEVLLMEVTTLDPPLGRVQISVNRRIASEFNFHPFSSVTVTKLSPVSLEKYEVALVECFFQGSYLSNGDLWLVRSSLMNKPVFVGKTIYMFGVKIKVEEIHQFGDGVELEKKSKSGIITKKTRFVFRSGSAQIYWMIQCSLEMWSFADDGDLMLEKLFSRFIPAILDRWNVSRAKHSLTVIFFCRTVFNGVPSLPSLPVKRFSNPSDHRRYVDFYHVPFSNITRSDWKTLLPQLQDEFHSFPRKAEWAVAASNTSSYVCGLPSIAQEGNNLEVVNLALNIMERHYIDRDVERTGQLMVLMTAGCGVFEVDSRLARLTKDRMTNQAVGFDVVSLAQPPNHLVPLFIHNQPDKSMEFDQPHPFDRTTTTFTSPGFNPSATDFNTVFDTSPAVDRKSDYDSPNPNNNNTGKSKKQALFHVPHWINLSFPFNSQKKKKFQPIFENRMFPIPEAHKGNFPSALLAPLERVSTKARLDLDLSAQVATWATTRKIPSRDELRPWFPLVQDLVRPVTNRLLKTPNISSLSSKLKKNSTESNLKTNNRLLNTILQQDNITYLQALPPPLPPSPSTQATRSMEPSPSLVALQSFKGIGEDLNFHPKVSWIHDFSLPAAASTNSLPATKTSSTRALTIHNESSTSLLNNNSLDRNAIIDKQKKHDASVFSVGGLKKKFASSSSTSSIITSPNSPPNNKEFFNLTLTPNLLIRNRRSRKSSDEVASSSLNLNDADDNNNNLDVESSSQASSSSHSSHFSYEKFFSSHHHHHHSNRILVNPFQHESLLQWYAENPSHSRDRWLHLFSQENLFSEEDDEYEMYGLNDLHWKSLQTPAMLPLTTGFAPPQTVLTNNYVFGTYSLVSQDMDEILLDIICLRLSEDFQIFDPEDFDGEFPLGLRSFAYSKSSEIYTVTIGHQVHQIIFSKKNLKLDVTQYVSNQETEAFQYSYLLWDNMLQTSVPCARSFKDQSASGCDWNYVDNLLMGESMNDLPGSEFRFRRLSYLLFNIECVLKLCNYLKFKLNLLNFDNNIKIHSSIDSFDVKIITKRPTWKYDLPIKTEKFRSKEWLYLNLDDVYSNDRCFHFDIRWIVASGKNVQKFLQDLKDEIGKDEIFQFEENCVTFDNHSFMIPKCIQMNDNTKTIKEIANILVVKEKLFVYDSTNFSDEFVTLVRSDGQLHASVFCRIRYSPHQPQVSLDFLPNRYVNCEDFENFMKNVQSLLLVN